MPAVKFNSIGDIKVISVLGVGEEVTSQFSEQPDIRYPVKAWDCDAEGEVIGESDADTWYIRSGKPHEFFVEKGLNIGVTLKVQKILATSKEGKQYQWWRAKAIAKDITTPKSFQEPKPMETVPQTALPRTGQTSPSMAEIGALFEACMIRSAKFWDRLREDRAQSGLPELSEGEIGAIERAGIALFIEVNKRGLRPFAEKEPVEEKPASEVPPPADRPDPTEPPEPYFNEDDGLPF